jgi:hypothetical protein
MSKRNNNAILRAMGLVIESLEVRRLLAVSVTPFDSDGDAVNELIITGDSGNNRVLVYDDPFNNRTDVVIDANNDGAFNLGEVNFPFGQQFEEIETSLGSGNDTLRYFLANDFTDISRSVLTDLAAGPTRCSSHRRRAA